MIYAKTALPCLWSLLDLGYLTLSPRPFHPVANAIAEVFCIVLFAMESCTPLLFVDTFFVKEGSRGYAEWVNFWGNDPDIDRHMATAIGVIAGSLTYVLVYFPRIRAKYPCDL